MAVTLANNDFKTCYHRALNLLARREHSQQEMQTKLQTKGFNIEVISSVIHHLLEENLLSDARYAECYIAQRAERGYGFLRIRQELQQRGIQADLIAKVLENLAIDWTEQARLAWEKYLRTHTIAENPIVAKLQQKKFLYSRGFNEY